MNLWISCEDQLLLAESMYFDWNLAAFDQRKWFTQNGKKTNIEFIFSSVENIWTDSSREPFVQIACIRYGCCVSFPLVSFSIYLILLFSLSIRPGSKHFYRSNQILKSLWQLQSFKNRKFSAFTKYHLSRKKNLTEIRVKKNFKIGKNEIY